MLDALAAAILGARADATFTEADLRAAGIDPTRPDRSVYPDDPSW